MTCVHIKYCALAFLFICLLSFCKKEKDPSFSDSIWSKYLDLPQSPYNYSNQNLPIFYSNQFIIKADNTPIENPITDWGATLGRVLFYDKKLSKNHTISCSSCHRQTFGFSDTAVRSQGFNNGLTKRHSMSLANSKYYFSKSFFWDERANSLEKQVLQPVQDPVEMGMELDSVVDRIKKVKYYPALFYKAFGSYKIDTTKISYALSQFVRAIISYRSPYDKGREMVTNPLDPFPNFNQSQNRGKRIFFKPGTINCAGCHTTDAFIGDVARNNGLPATSDRGVGDITGNARDYFTFKTPSLKNIAIRPPYMHDGRFGTLQEVIDHYSSGIADNSNLDPHFRLPGGGVFQFNLTTQEKADLIAFLTTLTDTELIHDKKFSTPFKR